MVGSSKVKDGIGRGRPAYSG